MIVRSALPSDSAGVSILLHQLGYQQTPEDVLDRLCAYSDNEKYGVLVAEDHGNLMGMVAFSMTENFVSPMKRCRIEALIVDNQFRRRGIGKELLRRLEECAHAHGCLVVEVTSGLRRKIDGSHDFYHSCGYHNEGVHAKVYLRKQLHV